MNHTYVKLPVGRHPVRSGIGDLYSLAWYAKRNNFLLK